jgi:DNA replication licensing factor MCM4
MQAAVDPSTGKIDISILTTGITGAMRRQRADRALFLLELIKSKGKVLVLKQNSLFDEFKEKMVEKGEQVSKEKPVT